jgi:sugar phosphate isomerase/epimerase
MKPQTSISTSFNYSIPIEKQLTHIAEAGFTSVSIGSNKDHFDTHHQAKRQELKSALQHNGLTVHSLHAPVRLDHPEALVEIAATIYAASDLEASCVVAHGGPFACGIEGFDEKLNNIITTCQSLAPIAVSSGITLALENVMPGPATDLVRKALAYLDDNVFGLCYDSSHDQIDGPRKFDLIDEFKNRIFAVHLSDRIKSFIDHVIPGEGFIDWHKMCKRLRAAQFSNAILMEVIMENSSFKEPKVFLQKTYEASVQTWQLLHPSL